MSFIRAMFNLHAEGDLVIVPGNKVLLSDKAAGKLIAELAKVDPEVSQQFHSMMQKIVGSVAYAALLRHHQAQEAAAAAEKKPDYGLDLKNALRMH